MPTLLCYIFKKKKTRFLLYYVIMGIVESMYIYLLCLKVDSRKEKYATTEHEHAF